MFGFGKKTIDSTATLVEKTGAALDKLFTSDEERKHAKALIEKIKQQPSAWAHELNVINANSTNWFNSGWRPAFGWVAALSALLYFVPQYLIAAYVWVGHATNTPAGEAIPAYPVSENGLWELITILLGGAAIRSFDKLKGTAKH